MCLCKPEVKITASRRTKSSHGISLAVQAYPGWCYFRLGEYVKCAQHVHN